MSRTITISEREYDALNIATEIYRAVATRQDEKEDVGALDDIISKLDRATK